MQSLYGRLFTYRGRPDRSPLEDFLTEALADLLNRLPEAIVRRFVSRLLAEAPGASGALKQVWPLGQVARWSTQRPTINGKIADLVFEVGGRPMLVVENKIGAGFQEHALGGAGDGAQSQHQLATYGQWVAKYAWPSWGGAIVLLTRWTPAPADFANGSSYNARHRSTIMWSDLAKWIKDLSDSPEAHGSLWSPFADELIRFLREQKMHSELATAEDWEAIQEYLPSADRVRNSIDKIWAGAESSWWPITRHKEHVTQIATEYGCVWKFRYVARPDLAQTYIAAGIRFAFDSEYLAKLPERAQRPNLFVELSTEGREGAFDELRLPKPWMSAPGIWLAERILSDLPGEASDFVAEAARWAQARIVEIASAIGPRAGSAAVAVANGTSVHR